MAVVGEGQKAAAAQSLWRGHERRQAPTRRLLKVQGEHSCPITACRPDLFENYPEPKQPRRMYGRRFIWELRDEVPLG